MTDKPQYLAEFLTKKLEGYARLDGLALNASTSNCMAEGDEDFELVIYQTPPLSLDQLVTEFFAHRELQTNPRSGTIQIKKGDQHVGFVVMTGQIDRGHVLFSVRWLS